MMGNKLSFELLAWVITGVILCLVLAPIYLTLGDSFPFLVENGMFIIIFITFLRFIFLMPYHWFDGFVWFKLIMIFAVIPILLYLVDNVMDFQAYADEKGLQTFMDSVTVSKQMSLIKYIKSEYYFFWAGAFICSLAIPIKMIRSIWRMKNKKR